MKYSWIALPIGVVGIFGLAYWQATKPAPEPSTVTVNSHTIQPGLSELEVIAIVDSRLASLKHRELEKVRDRRELPFSNALSYGREFIYGSKDAIVTVIEYGDIECPFCQAYHGEIQDLVDLSGDTINWTFKHFPLSSHNPVALEESSAVYCSSKSYGNRTGWMVLDAMYKATRGNGKGVGDIYSFLPTIGISPERIQSCMDSEDTLSAIKQDFDEGVELGISETPSTVIINNATGQKKLVRGYMTQDQLFEHIKSIE